MLTVPIEDLLRWNEITATRWRDLLRAHPHLLAVATDIRNSGDVAHLLQHIAAVELRYAERLASLPESDYDSVPFASPDDLHATHERALALIRPLLADEAFDWSQPIEFPTITLGRIRATRRDVLIHMLLHSVRHYAQLAVIVRQAGVKPDWPMDFLMVNASRA